MGYVWSESTPVPLLYAPPAKTPLLSAPPAKAPSCTHRLLRHPPYCTHRKCSPDSSGTWSDHAGVPASADGRRSSTGRRSPDSSPWGCCSCGDAARVGVSPRMQTCKGVLAHSTISPIAACAWCAGCEKYTSVREVYVRVFSRVFSGSKCACECYPVIMYGSVPWSPTRRPSWMSPTAVPAGGCADPYQWARPCTSIAP